MSVSPIFVSVGPIFTFADFPIALGVIIVLASTLILGAIYSGSSHENHAYRSARIDDEK